MSCEPAVWCNSLKYATYNGKIKNPLMVYKLRAIYYKLVLVYKNMAMPQRAFTLWLHPGHHPVARPTPTAFSY